MAPVLAPWGARRQGGSGEQMLNKEPNSPDPALPSPAKAPPSPSRAATQTPGTWPAETTKSPASCLSLRRSTVPSEMTVTVVLSLVQSLSHVRLFETPWTTAHQAPLSSTISWSLFKFMFIESLMLSNHLILCHPLLLPFIFPIIKVFSSEMALCILYFIVICAGLDWAHA